jgi:hypothetical protein
MFFRRVAFGALLVVLVLTLAAPPAQAAQRTPSAFSALTLQLAGWLAHWWPWGAGRTPPVTVKCGSQTDPNGFCH